MNIFILLSWLFYFLISFISQHFSKVYLSITQMKALVGKGKQLLHLCTSVVVVSQLDFHFLLRNLEGGWLIIQLQIDKGGVHAWMLLTTLLSLKTDMWKVVESCRKGGQCLLLAAKYHFSCERSSLCPFGSGSVWTSVPSPWRNASSIHRAFIPSFVLIMLKTPYCLLLSFS